MPEISSADVERFIHEVVFGGESTIFRSIESTLHYPRGYTSGDIGVLEHTFTDTEEDARHEFEIIALKQEGGNLLKWRMMFSTYHTGNLYTKVTISDVRIEEERLVCNAQAERANTSHPTMLTLRTDLSRLDE